MSSTAKSARFLLLGLAAAVTLLGILLWVTTPQPEVKTTGIEGDGAPRAVVRVPSFEVSLRPVQEEVLLSGVVKPIRRVLLAAEIDGRIVSLGAREHEAVQAGQEIIKLDDSLRQAALDRSAAGVLRATATHRLAQLELERRRDLATEGVVSTSELDVALSRERETFGALAEARAMRDEARALLARTSVHAPFDGVLTNFDLEVGDRLEPGRRVGEVIDISSVEVEIGVNEAQVVALDRGQSANLQVAVHPDRLFPGTIRHVGNAVEPETRKFPVEIVARNSEGLLLPGMVAEVRLTLGEERPQLRVPRQATVEEFGLTYVFVLDTDQDPAVARRKRVSVRNVAFKPAEVEVLGGLASGQLIAAGNVRNLRDGLPVVIEEQL